MPFCLGALVFSGTSSGFGFSSFFEVLAIVALESRPLTAGFGVVLEVAGAGRLIPFLRSLMSCFLAFAFSLFS
ncbi:MAG: hypothetical protein IPK94_21075 [Saprospiraceae bacterium]|nr:hypothetical protein [Saprospiraceae bacterium]